MRDHPAQPLQPTPMRSWPADDFLSAQEDPTQTVGYARDLGFIYYETELSGLWRRPDDTRVLRFDPVASVPSVLFEASGRALVYATGPSTGRVVIGDHTREREPIYVLRADDTGTQTPILSDATVLAVSPKERWLAYRRRTDDGARELRFYDLETSTDRGFDPPLIMRFANSFHFNEDETRVAVQMKPSVHVFDLETWAPPLALEATTLHRTDARLTVGHAWNQVFALDGSWHRRVDAAGNNPHATFLSPDGRWFFVRPERDAAWLRFDVRDLDAAPVTLGPGLSASFSPDGRYLAWSSSGNVTIWEMARPQAPVAVLPGRISKSAWFAARP